MKRLAGWLILAVCLVACKAPKAHYLVKDGGYWDIASMEYHVTGDFTLDTVFTDAGEVYFEKRSPDERDGDLKEWMLEGYMTAPEFAVLDGLPTFLVTTKWFNASTRTGISPGNDIGFWNFELEKWEVQDRTTNSMEWTYTTWEGDESVTYYLERR